MARRARNLATVGIAALIAQDASALVVTGLANGHGGSGAVVLYNYGWQMFLVSLRGARHPDRGQRLPGAVRRARPAGDGPRCRVRRDAAASTRAVLLMSCLGAALLAAIAVPAARVFTSLRSGHAARLGVRRVRARAWSASG